VRVTIDLTKAAHATRLEMPREGQGASGAIRSVFGPWSAIGVRGGKWRRSLSRSLAGP